MHNNIEIRPVVSDKKILKFSISIDNIGKIRPPPPHPPAAMFFDESKWLEQSW